MTFILIWHGICPKQSLKPSVIASVREKTIIGPLEPVHSVPYCGPNLAPFGASFCIPASHPHRQSTAPFLWKRVGSPFACRRVQGGRPICPMERFLIYVSCCCHRCQHTAAPPRHSPHTHIHTQTHPLLLSSSDSEGALELKEQSIMWVKPQFDTRHRLLLDWREKLSLRWFIQIHAHGQYIHIHKNLLHMISLILKKTTFRFYPLNV